MVPYFLSFPPLCFWFFFMILLKQFKSTSAWFLSWWEGEAMFAAEFMCLLREVSWGSTNVLLVFPMRKRSRKEVPSDFPRNPVRGVWEWFKAVPGDVWHETGHQETFYYQEVQKLAQTSLRSVPKACQSLRHLDNALNALTSGQPWRCQVGDYMILLGPFQLNYSVLCTWTCHKLFL